MATLTRTFTEAVYSLRPAANWTLKLTGTNVTATGSTVTLKTPTLTAKYVSSGKDRGYVKFHCRLSKGATVLRSNVYYSKVWPSNNDMTYMDSGVTYDIGLYDSASTWTVNTSTLFNSSNSTSKTVNISAVNTEVEVGSTKKSEWTNYYNWGFDQTDYSMGNVFTVTLNAPPLIDSSHNKSVLYSQDAYYAGFCNISAVVNALSAQYGGNISSVTFTIGSQSQTVQVGQATSLSIPISVNKAGTFTPTVTFTDSRGQSSKRSLSPITIKSYVKPSVSFRVERTDSTGKPDDEGTYAVASATFTFTEEIAELEQPTVAVTSQTRSVTKTWYSTRASDGTIDLNSAVDWDELSSGDTVYCLISGLTTTQSYDISITPKAFAETSSASEHSVGTKITQTLSPAFYTVDFLAGGHGIAFGQLATEEKFVCNMPAVFNNDITIQDHSSGIGAYYGYANTDTIASGTSYVDTGISMNLQKGRYIVEAYAGFGGNTTGFRGIRISASDDGSTTDVATLSSQIQPALSSANWTNRLHTSAIIVSDNSDTTVKVQVLQNSGGNLSVTTQARWIRIR